MKRLLLLIIAVGLAVGFSMPGIAAQKTGAVVSANATGLSEKAVSDRATRKLNRQINRWAKKNDLSTVGVGATETSCTKGVGGLYRCTSSARVAG